MSRFGVISLLLVLGLDWGTSITPTCSDPFCKQSSEDESDFREASSSDSLLRARIGPLFSGSSSEGTTLRKFNFEDGDQPVQTELTDTVGEEKEAQHGFRYHHHHYHPEHTEEDTNAEPSDLSFRTIGKKPNSKGFSKKSNIMCKYMKAFLRRLVEIIRPFFR